MRSYNWGRPLETFDELSFFCIFRSQLLTVVSNNQATADDKYDLRKQDNLLMVENLCKIYKGNHQALENVSFNIASGEVRI